MLSRFPPVGLVLIAIVSIQLGAAMATGLFPLLGAGGTVAIRIIISALLLATVARGTLPSLLQSWHESRWLFLAFGACIAAMNFFFYQAIALIPLGAAVALEFVGPLGVAVLASRRLSHFGWVALAAVGILLLSPLSGVNLDRLGIFYALLAGGGWALFIVLVGRVSKRVVGNGGLVIGMFIAALLMTPFALPVLPRLALDPLTLVACFGVALLSTTLPFTLEFEALRRLSARAYGILVSMEPAVAALVGALLLGERLGWQGSISVVCVVVAAIGISISEARDAAV